MAANQSWEELAKQKRAAQYARIPAAWRLSQPNIDRYKQSERGVLHVPRECGLLSSSEIKITENYDAVALVSELRSGTLTAVEVTTAFCKRAALAQQLVRRSLRLRCNNFIVVCTRSVNQEIDQLLNGDLLRRCYCPCKIP